MEGSGVVKRNKVIRFWLQSGSQSSHGEGLCSLGVWNIMTVCGHLVVQERHWKTI